MSQYVFTMSSRMVAITVACMVLLCVLLFLMGIEIGKLVAPSPLPAPAAVAPGQQQSPSAAPAPAQAPAPAASTQ
ncbi:hypothetical protein [uncultured Variovorax sp.]|uniref:hypothetical protein n=1 Tax=uncultured Variovorax sp. TaxID=114708 RepID=UPI0025DC6017|nr:hypothetical protein [uncultured Variovorax sp.]